MEGQFPATREELFHVQMDVKHVQSVQMNHADRLLRLEKRQADDAALKSVWNSPFPGILSGTPQQDPVPTTSTDIFDDLDDEQSQNLLGSLHLETDDEPVRRGASRANSVRFDVSAIHGQNWTQAPRSSGESCPARPNSGFGGHPMIECSLSHKSDGRHSSAGHSVHSIHSAPSGRTSSLGLDTNFIIGGHADDYPLGVPGPPPGLFILGPVPSIIRCWLNENFSHSALLYAVVCTGSQKSHLDISLVKELDLLDHIQKNSTGNYTIRLPVYLPEAIITQPLSRTNSPAPQLPTMTANFEVIGVNQHSGTDYKRAIRVFLGSDTLRAHNADLFFSQNLMTLYGDDHIKISVPFARPEDDALFRNLCTTNVLPVKVELKATAPPFSPAERKPRDSSSGFLKGAIEMAKVSEDQPTRQNTLLTSPATSTRGHEDAESQQQQKMPTDALCDESPSLVTLPGSSSQHMSDVTQSCSYGDKSLTNHEEPCASTDSDRLGSPGGIWGSWRPGGIQNTDGVSLSGYNRASRGGRGMKVLKPSKAGRSSLVVRTGMDYEPPSRQVSGEFRRKNQAGTTESNIAARWESKRAVSDEKAHRELRPLTNVSRSNPIGGASAFAWMASGNPKVTSAAAE